MGLEASLTWVACLVLFVDSMCVACLLLHQWKRPPSVKPSGGAGEVGGVGEESLLLSHKLSNNSSVYSSMDAVEEYA